MLTGQWVIDFSQMDNEYGCYVYEGQSASPWELKESQIATELTEQQQIVRCPINADLLSILTLLREEEGLSMFDDLSFLSSSPLSQSKNRILDILCRNNEADRLQQYRR